MAKKLEGKKVAILVEEGFEEVELKKPKEALEEEGAKTFIISPHLLNVKAWDKSDWGESYSVDVYLSNANPNDYDALLLPGGVMNPDKLRTNKEAINFVKSFFDNNKPVAAICHGPWTLIEAGIVKGRRMTSFHSIQTDLKNAGANWVDEEVVLDKNLTTSRSPKDIPAFNNAIIEEFMKNK